MPGIHKVGTIAFRPDSDLEKTLIEERARLSGMPLKTFYSRAILYGHICVVGRMETISILVQELQQFQNVLSDIASQLQTGDILVSEEGYNALRMELLATVLTAVEIVNGAAYLFDKKEQDTTTRWKEELISAIK